MIDSPHKLGWRKNPPGEYPKARAVLSTRPARMGVLPPLSKPNLLPFRGTRIDQLNAAACVAFDLTRRLQLYFAANNLGANLLASPLDIYWKGRAEEFAGTDPDERPALLDQGTIPVNALTAIAAEGFALWDDYPYTDDPKRLASEPPASLFVRSYAQHGMQWGHIDEVGSARIDRTKGALLQRCPVGFGITVDEAFMQNAGQRITSINEKYLVGGHMLTVLAVLDADLIRELRDSMPLPADAQAGDVLFDNWWTSTQWGLPGYGFGLMSGDLFGSSWVDDVSMLEAVPPVLNRSEP